MTSLLIATDGDTETQECAHVPCVGGGTYDIPSTLQDFVFINNISIIVNAQHFDAHGDASTVPSTSLLYINGMAAVRDTDDISHHHNNTGVDVGNQGFVYGE